MCVPVVECLVKLHHRDLLSTRARKGGRGKVEEGAGKGGGKAERAWEGVEDVLSSSARSLSCLIEASGR
jgi:hypothetical protein